MPDDHYDPMRERGLVDNLLDCAAALATLGLYDRQVAYAESFIDKTKQPGDDR